MHLQCPNCQARLSIFVESDHQKRITKGACPNCGQKVNFGANPKALALVAPVIAFLTWLAWRWLPPSILGLGAGALIWLTVIRLDKAS